MTKTITHKKIVRDQYSGHILTCDECGLPFFSNEWEGRHECDPDKVYHADCCPECNHDTSPDYTIDTVGGL